MACLSDTRTAFRRVGTLKFLARVYQQTQEDDLFSMAAALAYSWLFAVFPFLIFLLTLTAYLPAETKNNVRQAIYNSMPQEAGDVIWKNVEDILKKPRGGLLSLGLLLTLFSASGGMSMTIAGINKCYEVKPRHSAVVHRLFAVFLTIVIASLVVSVLLLLPVGTVALNYLERHSGLDGRVTLWTVRIARFPVALGLMFLIVNLLYFLAPSIKQRFVWISPGAVFSVVMWLLLANAFGIYVQKFSSYSQTYGAVGGVVILLLLFYVDALVLLIGAELNSEIDFEVLGVPRGSRDFTGKPAD